MPYENPDSLVDFLFTHEYLFRQQTARFYPLPFSLIEKYPEMWDFSTLCQNPSIPWDVATLAQFENQIDWLSLSSNTGMRWTEAILNRYSAQLNWQALSQNPSFPFLDIVPEKYSNEINWAFLSSNPCIPHTDVFLEKYEEKIFWEIFKHYSTRLDELSPKFQVKMDSLPESPPRPDYILPDQTKRYIRWNFKPGSLPPRLQEVLEQPVSQIPEDFFGQYAEYWDWSNISFCIHIHWNTAFFERFYGQLHWGVTLNPAFYKNVLEGKLNDALIDKVCTRLNPENAVKFYHLEDKKDEYGVLPNVRFRLPGNPPWDTYGPVNEQWKQMLTSSSFDKPVPDVFFELSWFLRHPIRFADFHHWNFDGNYPAIIVSEKLKSILEQFELPSHRFYKIDLSIPDDTFGSETRTYYILYVPEQEYLYFDYAQVKMVEDQDRIQIPDRGPCYLRNYYDSSYFNRQMADGYPESILTPEAFLSAKEELHKRAPEKVLRPQEYIFDASLDLISSGAESPRNRIWVSENIKKAIEASGVTGIRFERIWECRPRMQGLETPMQRIKKEELLRELQEKFSNSAESSVQITVQNFKKAEQWAEEVLRNSGIVKKMFAENPPSGMDDDFMRRIREKEELLDVLFPDWFIRILKTGELPEGLEDYTVKPLENIGGNGQYDEFPIAVKTVEFADYNTSALFLVLKKGSYYELDDVIYFVEYDQGFPPTIIKRMDISHPLF